ncbi:MAG TPA: serine hydrolase [Bacteroidales bacterium]|nr:serine hydrolase [Bacteroidales bacterium]
MKKRRIINGILLLLVAILIGGILYLNSLMPIITGYAAKNLCSDVFVSDRKPADVEAIDLNFSFIRYTKNEVNYEDSSVVSKFLWSSSKAVNRKGFGSTLLRGLTEADLKKIKFPSGTAPAYSQDSLAWPLGNVLPDTSTGINMVKLGEISKQLINENAYKGDAFAFIVLHKGIPVAEAYKPQFSNRTRFLSWSMAKSFTNAMVGILVKEGKMDVNDPAGIDEWKKDDRSTITINNLLQMQSGLKWNEDYGARSDVTVMLHEESSMAKYAYDKPLDHDPGTYWSYSSGTANIVSYIIRKQFPDDSSYYSFSRTEFFNKIGIPDAVFEVDPSGTMVGSSYLYATARDFARFGLLFLNDGVFNGQRILPEGWVKYTTTPASASGNAYGAFFWLNRDKKFPSAPGNMYMCEGHDGQQIFILPDQQLVVVVLGYSPQPVGMDCDRLLKDILSALD